MDEFISMTSLLLQPLGLDFKPLTQGEKAEIDQQMAEGNFDILKKKDQNSGMLYAISKMMMRPDSVEIMKDEKIGALWGVGKKICEEVDKKYGAKTDSDNAMDRYFPDTKVSEGFKEKVVEANKVLVEKIQQLKMARAEARAESDDEENWEDTDDEESDTVSLD